MTLQEIIELARSYASARDRLSDATDAIAEEQARALRRGLPPLRRRVAECAAAEALLREAVERAPGHFERPRTRTVDGVKFGWRKQPGRICMRNEAAAIALLRKKFPELADTAIRTKESLDKAALRRMTATQLAAIGVTVEADSDETVVAGAATELDKRVAAMLAAAGEDAA